jgi:hypothetical protein
MKAARLAMSPDVMGEPLTTATTLLAAYVAGAVASAKPQARIIAETVRVIESFPPIPYPFHFPPDVKCPEAMLFMPNASVLRISLQGCIIHAAEQ